MKALTLWEPWASLIAYGWKEVETRDWYTSYRGPLAIHAANRKPDPAENSRITFLLGHKGFELPPLTFGAVVAVCTLAACVPTALVDVASRKIKPEFCPRHGWDVERPFGNYDKGRWAWILRDVFRLDRPIAAKGQRKLWRWDVSGELLMLALGPGASPWIVRNFQSPPGLGVSTATPISSPVASSGVKNAP